MSEADPDPDPGPRPLPDVDGLINELEAAGEALASSREAVEAAGRANLEALSEIDTSLRTLLDRYEETAVGTESFGDYVTFRGEIDDLLGDLPEDLPHRDDLDAIRERFDRRRLHPEDFAWARSELEPIRDHLRLREDARRAADRVREARRRAARRLEAIEDRLERLDRLADLATLDLDAPVDRLREPIEAYNRAVTDAFERLLRTASAREVASFLEAAAAYPLVDLEPLPDDVAGYVAANDAGERPIPELLELAEYSRSKLAHYVDDPDELKRAVATRRTTLERLDADALHVAWPPPPAAELRWRLRELVAVVGRLVDRLDGLPTDADDDPGGGPAADPLARLRTVRDRLEADDYDRLRRVARARADLTAAERELIADGELPDRRRELERRRDRLAAALEAVPEA